MISRLGVFLLLLLNLSAFRTFQVASADTSRPNIVIFLADDFGYGDLPSYGHPSSEAPALEDLARNGLRFTDFYSASSICTPSRASLLTGREPPRTGLYSKVLNPSSIGGLPLEEVTIAEVLKPLDYRTGLVGKWHLGIGANGTFMPTNQGFDYYYGIPYSHESCPSEACFYPDDPCHEDLPDGVVPCPLFENAEIVRQPADLVALSGDLGSRATAFIEESAAGEQPFFLYYAFHHTHDPQFAGKQFRNATLRGAYGDSIAEMDWNVGRVLRQLVASGVVDNTFVFFTSDNGPSLLSPLHQGSAGMLKCGKGTTYEGGQRVPAIAVWPGKIRPGVTREIASTLDLLPTIAEITGATLPDVKLDGVDMSPILFDNKKGNRDSFYYYSGGSQAYIGVYAVRHHQYKAHFITCGSPKSLITDRDEDCRPTALMTPHVPPLLFDLYQDPAEEFNLNARPGYSDILTELYRLKVEYEANMDWRENEVAKGSDESLEPCCDPGCTPYPTCCRC